MRIFTTVSIVSIISIASSVSEPANAASDAKAYFWPAHVDHIKFRAKSHAVRGRVTMTRGKSISIDGQQYMQIAVKPKPTGKLGKERSIYLRSDETGLYSRHSTEANGKEVLEVKFPAKVGLSWKTVDQTGRPSKRSIQSIEPCSTRRAKFDQCIGVAYEIDGKPGLAYYAPKYGEVIDNKSNGFIRRTITEIK